MWELATYVLYMWTVAARTHKMRLFYLYFLIMVCAPGKASTRIIDTNEVKYNFRYSVDDAASGVFNDHWENRIGDFVKGAYSLLDPDGKIRTVYYEVDGDKGYRAFVRRKFPGPNFFTGRKLKKHFTPIILKKPVGKITRDLLN